MVFVHGLWMTGRESVFLKRQLAKQSGFDCHVFRYYSLAAPMDQHVERCARFIAGIDAPRVHLVGHSLGGLVIYRLLESGLLADEERLGRVVFLGTPAAGSAAARRLGAWPIGRRLLGPAGQEEFLKSQQRKWAFRPELGIIAGSRSVGLGRALGGTRGDNDGTVSVEETRLAGATQHRVLPVSHTGMWLSPRVARTLACFLEHGRFDP